MRDKVWLVNDLSVEEECRGDGGTVRERWGRGEGAVTGLCSNVGKGTNKSWTVQEREVDGRCRKAAQKKVKM